MDKSLEHWNDRYSFLSSLYDDDGRIDDNFLYDNRITTPTSHLGSGSPVYLSSDESDLSSFFGANDMTSPYESSLDSFAAPTERQRGPWVGGNTPSGSSSFHAATANPIPDLPLSVNPRFISPQEFEDNADEGAGVSSFDEPLPPSPPSSSLTLANRPPASSLPDSPTYSIAPRRVVKRRGRGRSTTSRAKKNSVALAGPETAASAGPSLPLLPSIPQMQPVGTAVPLLATSTRSQGKRKRKLSTSDDNETLTPDPRPHTKRKIGTGLTFKEPGPDFRHASNPLEPTKICRYRNVEGDRCDMHVLRTMPAITEHLSDPAIHGWEEWPAECLWLCVEGEECAWQKPVLKKGKQVKKEGHKPGADRFTRDCYANENSHLSAQKQCIFCGKFVSYRAGPLHDKCPKKPQT